ncbi:ferrous iron transport protein A [Flavobacterium azooxidireducens]|uniref:Ferrous iron transport protein A n=1 Tax=Flavobacterium azooxidireducens TaxID=1871076 RepID=A0ABY4KJW3_9FLAO|nr:FeoA family protein [Flavobacterium azooxidireducens]UPQ80670.1 ferrous iron transport protein A [Flavobacterium azooxidireducens]
MQTTANLLQKGQKAIIISFNLDTIPLKLIEMGCMEGHLIELVQTAPLGDPLYLNINGTHLAIRKEMASDIVVEIIEN